MANELLRNFNFSFSIRNAPKSGPTSSNAWNDSFTELANDLSNIALEWNTKLVKIIEGLPNGSVDTSINVFVNGLDAKNMWVDQDSTASSDETNYFNSSQSRPNTVKEQFDHVYTTLSSEVGSLESTISAAASALTIDEKNAIGANIFDATATSSSSSLDGKSENNRLNILQVANDVYGSDIVLNNNGSAILTNSIRDMVDALLELHNGNWADDIVLDHVGAISPAQTDVGPTLAVDDTFTGVATDTTDDLNRIRNELKLAKGTAGWTTSNTALYAGGADSLEDLLVGTAGSAAKSATNPWGYHYDDVNGLQTVLDNIRDFTGQDSHADATPAYHSNNYVNDGEDLELSIGNLDASLTITSGVVVAQSTQLAALETFVGQDNNTDSTPTYSSNNYVVNNEDLETAIGRLDAALSTVSGAFSSAFTGLSDTPANFVGEAGKYVSVNASETALEFTANTATVSGDIVVGSVTASGSIIVGSGNITIMDSGAGLILYAPDGVGYRVTVNNAGALTTAVYVPGPLGF